MYINNHICMYIYRERDITLYNNRGSSRRTPRPSSRRRRPSRSPPRACICTDHVHNMCMHMYVYNMCMHMYVYIYIYIYTHICVYIIIIDIDII